MTKKVRSSSESNKTQKPPGYWTLSRCIKDARLYSSRFAWFKASRSAYSASHSNGWLSITCRHMKKPTKGSPRTVYVLLDYKKRTAYVGLTDDMNRRFREHIYRNKELRHSHNRGTLVLKIVRRNLDEPRAKLAEARALIRWRKRKYRILNVAKTGSLGGNIHIWTKEAVYQEIKKYKTSAEWRKKSLGSYNAVLRNKWLSEINSVLPPATRKHRSLNDCMNDAMRFGSAKEWRLNSPAIYLYVSRRKSWKRKCLSLLEKRKRLTKAQCAREARKYTNRTDFRKGSGGAYSKAWTKNWLSEICRHMVTHGWNIQTCRQEAKKYETKIAWMKASRNSYNFALRRGWVPKLTKHMSSGMVKWTLKKCKQDARRFSTRIEWRRGSGAYCVAWSRGWLDKCCIHMKSGRLIKWTKRTILVDAKKYGTRWEWGKASSVAYYTAKKLGVFERATSHMAAPRSKPSRANK